MNYEPEYWDGTKEPQENKYLNLFEQSCLDQTQDYPAPVAVISINQNDTIIPMLTLKSFSLWKGKQKSKKTTALALITAAYLQQNISGLVIASVPGKVLYIDTEQGQSYAARTMKLILKLCGATTNENLIYSDMTEYTPGERIKMFTAAVQADPEIRFVIIDGEVDLMTDFMDSREAMQVITHLRKIGAKHNLHIAAVLHENKADKNARAHIGSISTQKCEIEISTEVDTNDRMQSIVTCTTSRGIPFEQFAIRWDKGSLPTINESWKAEDSKERKSNRKYEEKKQQANDVFKPLTVYSFTDAVANIINSTGQSKPTAVRYLKDWATMGFVSKGDDGNYRRAIV